MEKPRIFIKRTIRLGNSAGVLLPKSLLDSEVKVTVLRKPVNVKRDMMRILEPVLEEIIGIYVTKEEKPKIDVLVISTKIRKDLKNPRYTIRIVPLVVLKKTLKNNINLREDIKNSKVIINRKLLEELKEII